MNIADMKDGVALEGASEVANEVVAPEWVMQQLVVKPGITGGVKWATATAIWHNADGRCLRGDEVNLPRVTRTQLEEMLAIEQINETTGAPRTEWFHSCIVGKYRAPAPAGEVTRVRLSQEERDVRDERPLRQEDNEMKCAECGLLVHPSRVTASGACVDCVEKAKMAKLEAPKPRRARAPRKAKAPVA